MKYFLGVLLVALSWSCKKDEPEEKDKTPTTSTAINVEDVLKNWSSSIIIPGYEKYNADAADLQSAVTAFRQNVTQENLDVLRSKWKAAYLSWQSIGMFEFGPAAEITLRGETNIYPTDVEQLEKLVADGSTNIDGANKLDVKGLPALDYLLYNDSDSAILAQFTNVNSGSNRLNFLIEVTSQIAENAAMVNTRWSANGGNYGNQFNSAVGTDVGGSLGLVINTLNQHLERHLRDGKLGIPNGNRNFSGNALPGHVEATHKGDISIELAEKNLHAVESFYLGKSVDGEDRLGLDDYLESIGAKYNDGSLNDAIKSQFAACKEKLATIPKPLKENLVSNKSKIDDAVKELQKLIVLTKTDIPSATGILITYQDNDGD